LGYRYILSPAAGVATIFPSSRSWTLEFADHAPDEELTRIPPVPKKSLLCMPIPSAYVVIVLMKLVTETERHYAALMPFPQIEANLSRCEWITPEISENHYFSLSNIAVQPPISMP
jgi:hypothetical protein